MRRRLSSHFDWKGYKRRQTKAQVEMRRSRAKQYHFPLQLLPAGLRVRLTETLHAVRRPSIGHLASHMEKDDVRIEPWKYGAAAAVCVSSDFELAWASQYAGKERAVDEGWRTRAYFPDLIQAFEETNVPITWAVVGHLFLNGCLRDPATGFAHSDLPRPQPYSNRSWSFEAGDWYQNDPCTTVHDDPEWYAPDLIDRICSSPTPHEIGSHSFSHTDFSYGNCPREVAEAELRACRDLAAEHGLQLKSFVFPGNFEGNFEALARLGFIAYRGSTNAHLAYPNKVGEVWNLPGSLQLFDSSVDYHRRLARYVRKAIETGTLIHLSFHPSESNPSAIQETLVPGLRYLRGLEERGLLWIATMEEIASYCEARGSITWKAFKDGERVTRIDVDSDLDREKYPLGSITLSVPWAGSMPRSVANGTEHLDRRDCFIRAGRLFVTQDSLPSTLTIELK